MCAFANKKTSTTTSTGVTRIILAENCLEMDILDLFGLVNWATLKHLMRSWAKCVGVSENELISCGMSPRASIWLTINIALFD